MAEAKETNGGESKGEIAKYKALKKRALGAGGEQPVEQLQELKDANAALYEKLMDLEMGAAERYTETISAFEKPRGFNPGSSQAAHGAAAEPW